MKSSVDLPRNPAYYINKMRIQDKQETVKYLIGYWEDGEFWASSETPDLDQAKRELNRLRSLKYKDHLIKPWSIVCSRTTFEAVE